MGFNSVFKGLSSLLKAQQSKCSTKPKPTLLQARLFG